MKKQELTGKSDTEKKGEILQGRSTQTGTELGDIKLNDDFQQLNAESSSETLLSILSTPEFLHSVNASQKVNMISHLQETHGNRYVQRVIQAKLKIGLPGDIYEQEADRVADEVMRMPEPQVQRQSEEEKGEEQTIWTKEVDGQAPELTATLESRIHTLRGSGQPLPESVRNFFEPRFGYDLSQVRIHKGTLAAETARSLNARAFTVGCNIMFGGGQYAPENSEGKQLLAHELAHVIQQGEDQTPKVQMNPVSELNLLALRAEFYGCERLEELSAKQILAVEDFIGSLEKEMRAVLTNNTRLAQAVFGIEMAFLTSPGAGILVYGMEKINDYFDSVCTQYLADARHKCREEVTNYKEPFKRAIIDGAEEFAEYYVNKGLDTQNPNLFYETYNKHYEIPSETTVYNRWWNVLCERWNRHLRASSFWSTYPGDAHNLLMELKSEEEVAYQLVLGESEIVHLPREEEEVSYKIIWRELDIAFTPGKEKEVGYQLIWGEPEITYESGEEKK